MPYEVRNLKNCSLNSFKNKLDSFIDWIPDTPSSQTYYPIPTDRLSATPSNSLIDWMRYLEIPARRGGVLKSILSKMKQSQKFQEAQIQVDPKAYLWTNSYSKGPGQNDAPPPNIKGRQADTRWDAKKKKKKKSTGHYKNENS